MAVVFVVVSAVLGAALVVVWRRWRQAARAETIRRHPLPAGLFDALRLEHPALTQKDCELVAQALRQFFLVHLRSGGRFVAMPSQVVDDLWHAFILDTRAYARFCERAFGQFLHHTPAVALGSQRRSNVGLRRCWWHACREENIAPRRPTRLPLLFAIDGKLGIAGGFRYVVDCRGVARDRGRHGDGSAAVVHCGSDFADASVDGSTEGFGDAGAGDGGDGGGGGCGGGD